MSEKFESRKVAACATLQHQSDGGSKKKAELEGLLYDLCDLALIFKVTKRTLFTWRSKNLLPLIDFGGKLYLTHSQLMHLINEKEAARV